MRHALVLPSFEVTFQDFLTRLHQNARGKNGRLAAAEIRGEGGLVENLVQLSQSLAYLHEKKVVLGALTSYHWVKLAGGGGGGGGGWLAYDLRHAHKEGELLSLGSPAPPPKQSRSKTGGSVAAAAAAAAAAGAAAAEAEGPATVKDGEDEDGGEEEEEKGQVGTTMLSVDEDSDATHDLHEGSRGSRQGLPGSRTRQVEVEPEELARRVRTIVKIRV